MVSELDGKIQCNQFQGIFADDTRFLSHYACYIDNMPWVRLTSSVTRYSDPKSVVTFLAPLSRSGRGAGGEGLPQLI
jgi:hypothetical protein